MKITQALFVEMKKYWNVENDYYGGNSDNSCDLLWWSYTLTPNSLLFCHANGNICETHKSKVIDELLAL